VRNKFFICAAACLCALFLSKLTQARSEQNTRTQFAPAAIVHQSGGSVAQPYVRPVENPPHEKVIPVNPALDRHHRIFKLHRRLQDEGVQFIRVGEDLTLVLRASDYFYSHAPRLLTTRRTAQRLWLIAKYLNNFEKIDINVDAYTGDRGSNRRNLALSQHRADAIVDSLLRSGVDARLIFAKGYGEAYPLTTNKTEFGQLSNERIEISIRMLPLDSQVRQTAW
jgi:intracellular multiplication protein IcmN